MIPMPLVRRSNSEQQTIDKIFKLQQLKKFLRIPYESVRFTKIENYVEIQEQSENMSLRGSARLYISHRDLWNAYRTVLTKNQSYSNPSQTSFLETAKIIYNI